MPDPDPIIVPTVVRLDDKSLVVVSCYGGLGESVVRSGVDMPCGMLDAAHLPDRFRTTRGVKAFGVAFRRPASGPIGWCGVGPAPLVPMLADL